MRFVITVCGLLAACIAFADNHEEKNYIYATYLECEPTEEEGADEAFEEYYAPVYEAAMESGDITAWGYLKHHTGGKWRRVTYHMGPSVVDVIRAVEKNGDALDEALDEAGEDGLGEACESHDDYIWESKAGNVADERGSVGLSVYYVCDMVNESRADELVETVFGPVYDEHTGSGKLTSWGWSSHVVGGKYRRLMTTSAASVEDLFRVRGEILESFAGSSAGREFSSICGSHSDYLWNIAMEGR